MIPADLDYFDLSSLDNPGPDEWHNVATITVRELIADGIIGPEWWALWDAYDAAQRERMWAKFRGRFDYREIGIIPVGRWRDRVIAKLNEIMPKYKPIYAAIASGVTVMTDSDEWHKYRDVWSRFPQSGLGGSDVDYASSGTDREYETVRDRGLLDVGEAIQAYNDVDVMILDDLESLFFALKSTSIPYL